MVASLAWLTAAGLFVGLMLAPTFASEVRRVELAYFSATLLLCALLWLIYRLAARQRAPARAAMAE